MGRLDEKVAVITGGTRGIGYAITHAYALEGARVVLCSRHPESVSRAVSSLQSEGLQARGIPADASSRLDLQNLMAHALLEFGQLDIWINNAALGAPYGPTWLVEEETFEKVLQVNILGAYYGSILAVRHFIAQGSGKLINMLGAGARRKAPFQTAYGSSKAWLRSFTSTLAAESKGSGVGVFAYSPGMVLTEMMTNGEVIDGSQEGLKEFPRILRMWARRPEEVVEKAIWLASKATDGKTGLEVYNMNPVWMMTAAVQDRLRQLLHLRSETPEIHIKTIPPAGS
jgi:NAD(P)-dependent dehydrogenase (short-subunit alcohol dehydrogenase family)